MTAAPAKHPVKPVASSARRVAAVHTQGGRVRLLFANADGAGRLSDLEANSFAAADTASLAAALGRSAPPADAVIRVVPSAQTVCRCVPIPADKSAAGDRAQLAAALSLLAEAELPAHVPAHRRTGGIIHPGLRGTAEAALLIGWPQRPDEPPPSPLAGDEDHEVWTPEVAALAALARAMEGAPTAVYADRESGSVAVVAAGPSRALARVLRLDNSTPDGWRAACAAAVAETRASAGLDPAPFSPDDRPQALTMLGASRPMPADAPADPAWLREFGILYGAIWASAQPDPAVASLVGMRAKALSGYVSPLERSIRWLSSTTHAVCVLAACLTVLLVWPLSMAAARQWLLQRQAGGPAALQEQLSKVEQQAAFYKLLRTKRWPMTKLMADIAGAAPVGVALDTLDLSRDQGVTIHGTADSYELVTTFRKNLSDTRVFSDLLTPNIDTANAKVQFQLSAQVTAPLYPATPAQDFAAKPLADRLYGEGAAQSGGDAPSEIASDRSSSQTRGAGPGRRGGRNGRDTRSGRDTREPASAPDTPAAPKAGPVEIPAPLTDAQIAAMDRTTAMTEWTKRNLAAGKVDDAAIKQRLKEEAAKCRQRMLDAGKAAGGTN